MGLMDEYIQKKMGGLDLEAELLRLIKRYNEHRGTYLIVYAGALSKPMIPDIVMSMDDYYIVYDLLKNIDSQNLDFYIETPGGSGETAEEIARFIRTKFETVNFVVSGEAKSAGTILVLSGNDILMTKSGSLGPIDAQVKVGRSVVSAYDYCGWVEEKRKVAEKHNKLNPLDATMVAQISPGELTGVKNALEFARDLVVEWLPKYKFKEWSITETKKESVTEEMKQKRAKEIAKELTNHEKWRSHGRSIKIDDLQGKLRITCIDDDPELSDIVYRIQTVIRMLYATTSTYKIFATEEHKIFRQATQIGPVSSQVMTPQQADVIQFELTCQKCGKVHKMHAKFVPDPRIDEDFKKRGSVPYPVDTNKLVCECGFEHDLSGMKNQIETQVGKKIA